jgi:hypothetical protein
VALGVTVEHILADGSLENHDAALSRLARMINLREPDLVHSREQLIADAYRKQGERIAYEAVEPAENSAVKGLAG